MIEEQTDTLINPAIEIAFVGSFYKEPELYVEYGRLVKSKYDLGDVAARFFYDSFEVMFKTYSQEINQQKLTAFMASSPERADLYRKYGGWKEISSWMELACPDDVKKTYLPMKGGYAVGNGCKDQNHVRLGIRIC